MNARLSDFDRLVERYYPAVYHLVSEITSTPLEAMLLTNRIFKASQSRTRQGSVSHQNGASAAASSSSLS